MLYFLLAIIAVGVLFASEEGKRILYLLLLLGLIGLVGIVAVGAVIFCFYAITEGKGFVDSLDDNIIIAVVIVVVTLYASIKTRKIIISHDERNRLKKEFRAWGIELKSHKVAFGFVALAFLVMFITAIFIGN